ncbi:hypothetical protein [Kordiimonas pumila]|uniref:Uncharacterized protein n=1 Tax=Kordiimonas pumila TaxID=2161677 RepID=A0ABV7D2A1_9PROT|nr:hypothetical protein [Kordiimonas pumila]
MTSFRPMSVFRRMVGGIEVPPPMSNIAVGDRYEHMGQGVSIWVVERISKVSMSSFPLISLVREGRPDLKKILSLSVLEEGQDFRPTTLQ